MRRRKRVSRAVSARAFWSRWAGVRDEAATTDQVVGGGGAGVPQADGRRARSGAALWRIRFMEGFAVWVGRRAARFMVSRRGFAVQGVGRRLALGISAA
jgi:hypothetical protein